MNGIKNSDVFDVMQRQERLHANMEATDTTDTKQVSPASIIAGY